MSQWLRWYVGTAEDSKFRIIARASKSSVSNVIAIWAIVLESASDDAHRGVCTRDTEDFAVILDLDDEEVVRVLDAMQAKGLAERIESGLSVVSWVARQFEGDRDPTAADRQRKRREKIKAERDDNACHGHVTRDSHGVTVESRPPDTESDTDTEVEERAKALLSPGKPPTLDLAATEPTAEQEAFDAYNAVAARVGIPLAQKFDQTRRSKIRQRLKDCGGLSGWVAALEKLEASSHCTGSNDRGWRADLDFLLQSQSFTRLMEGRYDDRKPQQPRRQPQSRVSSADEVRRRLFEAACG